MSTTAEILTKVSDKLEAAFNKGADGGTYASFEELRSAFLAELVDDLPQDKAPNFVDRALMRIEHMTVRFSTAPKRRVTNEGQ